MFHVPLHHIGALRGTLPPLCQLSFVRSLTSRYDHIRLCQLPTAHGTLRFLNTVSEHSVCGPATNCPEEREASLPLRRPSLRFHELHHRAPSPPVWLWTIPSQIQFSSNLTAHPHDYAVDREDTTSTRTRWTCKSSLDLSVPRCPWSVAGLPRSQICLRLVHLTFHPWIPQTTSMGLQPILTIARESAALPLTSIALSYGSSPIITRIWYWLLDGYPLRCTATAVMAPSTDLSNRGRQSLGKSDIQPRHGACSKTDSGCVLMRGPVLTQPSK